jgi:hypothetical protein
MHGGVETDQEVMLGDLLDHALRLANTKDLVYFYMGSTYDPQVEEVRLYFSEHLKDHQLKDYMEVLDEDETLSISMSETEEFGAKWLLTLSPNRDEGAEAEFVGDMEVDMDFSGEIDVEYGA